MTREERQKRTEARRAELVAVLSNQDNSRTLKKIIMDKSFILAGVTGVFIMLLWFMTASILPLSFFGAIGKAERVWVDPVTFETTLVEMSTYDAAWNNLTAGITLNKASVYDMFYTRDPALIKAIGGLGCTLTFIFVCVVYLIVLFTYGRDFLLIAKTSIYIAKENAKSVGAGMKQAFEDVHNLYKDEEQKDTKVTITVPAGQAQSTKQRGRPKGSTKKATEATFNSPEVERTKEEIVTTNTEIKEHKEEKEVKESKHVEVKEQKHEKKHEQNFDELTDSELEDVVSGKKTFEQVLAERVK